MLFHHRVTVRFFDIDRAGVVFFARFFEYCHAAFEEMLLAMFGDLEQSFASGAWLMPVVHTDASYRAPARMGDKLVVALRVAKVGARSVSFDYTIGAEGGGVCAELRVVHAFIDAETGRPAPVSEPFVAGLHRLGLFPSSETGALPSVQVDAGDAGRTHP